jgi:2-polyprenyl-3-methyl-5-hydroxy-6-metoxy-1,4-benzoquinol methylase/glycosyltransferase involved in cell wall biosynthesis
MRARLGRVAWRLLRRAGGVLLRGGHGRTVERAVASSIVRARDATAFEQRLRAVQERGRQLFIFLPSIPWTTHLFQRPQHMARHLARVGHLVVYDCSGTSEKVDGLNELEPNLFLFKGDANYLASLPDPVLWAFTYNYPQCALYRGKCRVVYDWIDDLSVFPYDQEVLRRNHQQALGEATVVLSVARPLHDEASQARPDAIYLPNAVDWGHFGRAVPAVDDPIVRRLLAEGKPLAGYYGALASWFDYALLDALAARRPDWNFLLIGPDYDGSIRGSPALRRPNIYWIGPKQYTELPGYLQALTCALIPFRCNEITRATSPLKLYEYLAGGKPVITTPMPECMAHPEVRIGHGAADFADALDEAKRDAADPGQVECYRSVGRANSWEARARAVTDRLQALAKVRHLETPTNRDFFRAVTGYLSHAAGSDCFPLYFEYAVTTNERGRHVAGTLARHTELAGKDFFDVGCAYGGFLVAFAERGARVGGLDINPRLLHLAGRNLANHRVDGQVFQLDSTVPAVGRRFRRSKDVITCNDVIEHVDDPHLLVDNLATMLRPGGWLYLEIPNKDYAPYVIEDGHFRLFGITLLDHEEARAYFAALHPAAAYTVGHYLRLEQYQAMLERAGLTVQLLEDCVVRDNLGPALAAVRVLESEGARRLTKVPEVVREKVSARLREYLEELRLTPQATASQQRAFLLRYGVSFWQILARLPMDESPSDPTR